MESIFTISLRSHFAIFLTNHVVSIFRYNLSTKIYISCFQKLVISWSRIESLKGSRSFASHIMSFTMHNKLHLPSSWVRHHEVTDISRSALLDNSRSLGIRR